MCQPFFLSYLVGKDPAGWVTVDSKTGQVSTTQVLDRESQYVNESVYTVLILAVDHGKQAECVASLSLKDLGDVFMWEATERH